MYKAQSNIREFKRQSEGEIWDKVDIIMVLTVPTVFKVSEIQQDPIKNNWTLGTYMNFVNSLDLWAIAVPCTSTANNEQEDDGVPRGDTLIAPALEEWKLFEVAEALQTCS